MRLESLESRVAPAGVFLYTDVDGDQVKVTSSLGSNIDLVTAANVVGGQLRLLNLTPAVFNNTNITVSVVGPHVPGGNGLANVGHIDSTGHNLGNVTVVGDLGQIDAGSGIGLPPAINSLKVHSLGRLGTDTLGILSKIASITIKGHVFGTPASVSATDHFGFVAEQIGSLTIGTTPTAFSIVLAAGPHNDNLAVGETSDLNVHEV